MGFLKLGLALDQPVQVSVDKLHHDVQLVLLDASAQVL